MSKGSKRRPCDEAKVRRNWDMVFGKPNPHDTRKVEIDMPKDEPAVCKTCKVRSQCFLKPENKPCYFIYNPNPELSITGKPWWEYLDFAEENTPLTLETMKKLMDEIARPKYIGGVK